MQLEFYQVDGRDYVSRCFNELDPTLRGLRSRYPAEGKVTV